MPKTDTWELGLFNLLFQNNAFAGVGDSNGLLSSGTAGNLYISLHTDNPGNTGDQTTNEATYTGYTRVAMARNSSAWIIGEVGGISVNNAIQIVFPQCTGGDNTITYVGIGTAFSGTGQLLYYGILSDSLNISISVTPAIAAGQLTITES
jgi:hypothetical protein